MEPGSREDHWDAQCYDDEHAFVYEYGADLIDVLAPAPGERILDLGCGTGHLSSRIAERGATVVGLDSSRAMIESATAAHPAVAFVHADARRLPFDTPFDAVFSNAMLHWIAEPHQAQVIGSVSDVLRSGGRFVAELGGSGNVAHITDALTEALHAHGATRRTSWFFPTIGEYTRRLEAGGFEVRSAELFDRPTPLDGGECGLRTWLDMFAADALETLSAESREEVIRDVVDNLRPVLFRDGTWVADYRRLRVVAVRPDSAVCGELA